MAITKTDTDEANFHWVMGGNPRAIEAQEARGQAQLVATVDKLPSAIRKREQWEALGFTFGPPDEKDPLFCAATMPPGWAKRATDHSMWVDVVDDKGRKRGAMFYKAAFYDRHAHLNPPDVRYYVGYGDGDDWNNDQRVVRDCATGTVLFTTDKIARPAQSNDSHEAYAIWREGVDAIEAEAKAWLAERFPDHENPAAYWD
jgi:hypothetical protein